MILRKGDWMQTATGHQFWPMDPHPEDVFIEDIAAALAKICRFTGHCIRFYSVAEHCCWAATLVPEELKLAALLHDASEAYLADIIRPLKPYLSNYKEIEERVEKAIAERFKVSWPWPAGIKRVDNAMLAAERDQNMVLPPADWHLPEPPAPIRLEYWSPFRAETEYLRAFLRYGGISGEDS